jgi:thiamine-monophosphate kinase
MKTNIPFTSDTKKSISALGEIALIEQIKIWLGKTNPRSPFGIGDDCAVLPASKTSQLVTVDPIIYGRHFDQSVTAEQAGSKLLKRNISDIAAMGGKPTYCVISLSLDSHVKLSWLKSFYNGLRKTAEKYSILIVGGDIAETKGACSATLTLLGKTASKRFITRHSAKPNDFIFVTGKLGLSLQSGHHYSFTPRLNEALWISKQTAVNSLMDLSDGLAKDINCLVPKKAVACIYSDKLPLRSKASIKEALCDGEDYELLFTVSNKTNPEHFKSQWKKKFPNVELSLIGHMCPQGKRPSSALNLSAFQGYEHLSKQ